jgi:hypothetical protein
VKENAEFGSRIAEQTGGIGSTEKKMRSAGFYTPHFAIRDPHFLPAYSAIRSPRFAFRISPYG